MVDSICLVIMNALYNVVIYMFVSWEAELLYGQSLFVYGECSLNVCYCLQCGVCHEWG